MAHDLAFPIDEFAFHITHRDGYTLAELGRRWVAVTRAYFERVSRLAG